LEEERKFLGMLKPTRVVEILCRRGGRGDTGSV
jgi:hypothetical protein